MRFPLIRLNSFVLNQLESSKILSDDKTLSKCRLNDKRVFVILYIAYRCV